MALVIKLEGFWERFFEVHMRMGLNSDCWHSGRR